MRTAWALALAMALVLLPAVVFQAFILYDWYVQRRASQEQANLEFARATAETFGAYIRDVVRTQGGLGYALGDIQPLTPERATVLMERTRSQYKSIRSMALADMSGKVIASTDPRLMSLSLADRQYFKDIVGGKPWRVSDVIVGRDTGERTIVIARKLDKAIGGSPGIIMAAVDPTRMDEITLRIQRQGKSLYSVYDRQGRPVFISGMDIVVTSTWTGVDPALRHALDTGQEATGTARLPVGPEMRLVARVPTEDGFVVGASRSVEEVLAPVNRVLRMVIVLNLVAIGMSILGGVMVIRFISKRLDALREQADRIRSGDLSHRSRVSGIVELAQLSGAFNQMTEELQDRQQKLEQTVEDLRRSNQELEQFAYVASHDLQEPLRSITSYVQLLERRYSDKLDADAHRFIAFVVEAVSRLQQLINDLLAFSRVGTRGRTLAAVRLDEALEQARHSLREQIDSSGATIVSPPLPQVMGDMAQLTQVLQNLISNAIKFRQPDQPPRIEFSVSRKGQWWTICVRDNGIGIDAQYFDQIFVIFQRLHTRAKYPGTGIGLAICKKIIARHGGQLWVESAPGQGSSFCFTLQDAGVRT